MSTIFAGWQTARLEEPFVVFLIGLRVKRLMDFHKWVPVPRAMGPMIQELYAKKELSFLSTETCLTWRGVAMIQ